MATASSPVAAPPAAAASSAAAPAATPSTAAPASTGAASSTPPAAAAPPASQPSTEALSSEQSIEKMVAVANEKGFGDGTPAVPKVDTPAGEVKPAAEAKPAGELEAKPAAQANADEHSYTLEEDGFVGARDLATKLDSNEALKAALPAEIRNEIMANARLAEFGSEARKLVSSLDELKIVSETAQEHAGFVEAFTQIGADVTKGTDAMVQKLLQASALLNADGTPMKYADGSLRTDGTAGKFFREITDRGIHGRITKKVEESGDESLKAAWDLVMESVGLRPSTAVKTGEQDPALAARKAELDAQEARIREQTQASRREEVTQYQKALDTDLAGLYEGEVGKLMGLATGLESFTRTAVEQKLEKAVRDAIRTNSAYRLRKDRIEMMPRGPERRQKEVSLAKEFFRDNLAKIARPILAEAGVAVGRKVEQKTATQAARAENARSEVGGGAPVSPVAAKTLTPAEQAGQVREALKLELGHEPSDSEVNIAMMMAAAKAKGFAA